MRAGVLILISFLLVMTGCGGGSSENTSQPASDGSLVAVYGAWELDNGSSCSETVTFNEDNSFVMTSGDWNTTGHFTLAENGVRDRLVLYAQNSNGAVDCDGYSDDLSGYILEVYAHKTDASFMYWYVQASGGVPIGVMEVIEPPCLFADAGLDQTVFVNQLVTLTGSGYSDQNGSTLIYHWSLQTRPGGSSAELVNADESSTTFTPDIAGTYVFSLSVGDGLQMSAPSTVTVVVMDNRPIANAGVDQNATEGETVRLSGKESIDPHEMPLNYQWSIAWKPGGSHAVLADAETGSPSFIPDLTGLYRFSLIVDNGEESSTVDTVDVRVNKKINSLNYLVSDAEYSQVLDKIIIVSNTPENRLYIYDPETQRSDAVALPHEPTCVSVGPDGLHAAVGHDGNITYVDLGTVGVVKTFAVAIDVSDIVLDGNGYVHALAGGSGSGHIRTVKIETEEETVEGGVQHTLGGTLAKLHPDGKAIYGANNGIDPSNIEKYSIANGTAEYLYDALYDENHSKCGDLWISEDGSRIFTKCGNVFRATEEQETDMIFCGSFVNMSYIRYLDTSAETGKVALIPEKSDSNQYSEIENEENLLYVYTGFYMSLENDMYLIAQEKELPNFVSGKIGYRGNGRFVFFSSDGSQCHVILKADDSSGMLYDYGIVSYSME